MLGLETGNACSRLLGSRSSCGYKWPLPPRLGTGLCQVVGALCSAPGSSPPSPCPWEAHTAVPGKEPFLGQCSAVPVGVSQSDSGRQ